MTTISADQLDTIEPMEEMGALAVSAPHILDGIDDDVVQDLRAIGIELEPDVERRLQNAQREAMAARLLRYAQHVEADMNDAQAVYQFELDMLRASHERPHNPKQIEMPLPARETRVAVRDITSARTGS